MSLLRERTWCHYFVFEARQRQRHPKGTFFPKKKERRNTLPAQMLLPFLPVIAERERCYIELFCV
jgi:hypothetical protein